MNSTAPRVRALVGLLALCVGVSVLAGCYTTLRHPASTDIPDDYSYSDKSCYDCHDEASFYHSNYGIHYDYYDDPWFGYYSDPWWYDAYWRAGRGRDLPAEGSGERHHFRRGSPQGSPRGSAGPANTAPYLNEGYAKKAQEKADDPKKDEPEKKTPEKKRHAFGREKKK